MEWGDLSDAAASSAVAVELAEPLVAEGMTEIAPTGEPPAVASPADPDDPDEPASPATSAAPPTQAAAHGAPVNGASAVQAALRSLATGKGGELPAGIGPFLRAAQVVHLDDDQIVLELPAGPGFERLSTEPVTLRAVEDALAERVGHGRRLIVRPMGRGQGRPEQQARLTPERVKQDRLARMSRDEPLLGRIVQEWDLELLD